MSVSGRSPNLTLAMQQSAALLMEKSMPMGVGKLKDMNISRCGETGWKLRCRHVGSKRGSLCWYLRLTVCDWYAKRTVFGMKWNEPIFLSLFDLFIARIVMIAMYMKTIHAHTPHVWWQKPTQNITAYDTMTFVFWHGPTCFHQKGLCNANMLPVCACLLCPGSLFQAPSAGFPWVNSPKKSPEFVSSTLRYGNHILFQTCWAAFIPPQDPW